MSQLSSARKDALLHRRQAVQIAHTDVVDPLSLPIQGLVTAFQRTPTASFVGDSTGWFYASESDAWKPHFHLSSEVSAIATSATACVATSFGPESRILYLPFSQDQSPHVSRIDSRAVHDIWTADLLHARLVLGANKQAALIDDIAVSTSLQRLPTKSDVFALAQRDNLVYTGLRNGAILRFDTRIHKFTPDHLFRHHPTSITALKPIHDHQLLVNFLDGGMSTFDLRFPIRTPLLTWTGNVNSYTTRLPLATDPHEKFLFAAGQDNRIRLWSLARGGPPLCPGQQSVFDRPFEHRIAALQVVQETDGLCLWAASGRQLLKYTLGHRSGMIHSSLI